jgi:hypothetical protein
MQQGGSKDFVLTPFHMLGNAMAGYDAAIALSLLRLTWINTRVSGARNFLSATALKEDEACNINIT